MINCLIFDLDGTLVDNREANARSYAQAFADIGIQIQHQDYHKLFGLRFTEMISQLAPDLSPDNIQTIKQQKTIHYRDNVGLIRPNKSLINWLSVMHSHYKTALVTTASQINAEFVLDHFKLKPYFDVFVYGEDVNASKPDPECYKICFRRCGVEPKQCLIFEDSAVGLQAAEAAGAGVIKIFSEEI